MQNQNKKLEKLLSKMKIHLKEIKGKNQQNQKATDTMRKDICKRDIR